jgi:hypothetical protein
MTKRNMKKVFRPKFLKRSSQILLCSDTELAKNLGSILLHQMDLQLAKNWFYVGSLQKEEAEEFWSKDALAYAAVHAAIAAYRRCCNTGQRGRQYQLTATDAESVLSGGAKLHNELVKLGNKLVGHSLQEYEVAVVGARCFFDARRGLFSYIGAHGTTFKRIGLMRSDLEKYSILCHALETLYLEPKVCELTEKLETELREMSPEELFSMPQFYLHFKAIDDRGDRERVRDRKVNPMAMLSTRRRRVKKSRVISQRPEEDAVT